MLNSICTWDWCLQESKRETGWVCMSQKSKYTFGLQESQKRQTWDWYALESNS